MAKFYGKNAEEAANKVLELFKNPENLAPALAPVFINIDDSIPLSRWSWRNKLLAALEHTSDARGFKQWIAAGRQVKKGAKVFYILGPCIKKIEEDTGEVGSVVVGFKSIPVFRYEDTEGEDIGKDDSRNFIDSLPLIELAKAGNINVTTVPRNGAFLGRYSFSEVKETISLTVKDKKTWLHELMHAADRRVTCLKGTLLEKEVVAEFGAATLAVMLDMEHDADLGG